VAIRKSIGLIEVSVAIVILAIVTAGMLNIFSQGSSYIEKTHLKTSALNLGRQKIEELAGLALPLVGTTSESYGDIVDFPGFRQSWSVSEHIYPGQLREIIVTVFWANDNEQQSFTTLTANY
tara:strand:+ start:622 stop:987 length:366 start_codon:yes stop_codon:yes gene_type:complete